jgi:hypothetical protein
MPVAPPVLSHQDSVAIAEKVNKQVRAARLRDSVSRAKLQDSLQHVEEKRARDSLFAAFGARAAAAKRRIVVVEPRPSPRWPQAEQIGRAVADSLRSMLAKRSYIVVSPDSVRALRTQYPGLSELAAALSSDMLVSVRISERSPRRGATEGDSVMLQITSYDLGAKPQYGQRTLPVAPAWSAREELLGPLESLLLQTIGTLDEMSRAPRRAPGDAAQPFMQIPGVVPFTGRSGMDIRVIPPPKKPPHDTGTVR